MVAVAATEVVGKLAVVEHAAMEAKLAVAVAVEAMEEARARSNGRSPPPS